MPEELKPQAQAALGEIRSQFMQRMQEKGQAFKGNQWNARGVSDYLNANSAKLAKVFSPSELQQLKTMNDAGHILDIDRSYKGSAVQSFNLAKRAGQAIEMGAVGAGGHIAGPLGAVGGEVAGKLASRALEGFASKRAAQARVRKL
jgi:hypothetical protein